MLKNFIKLINAKLIWIKLGVVIALIVFAYFFGASNKENELSLAYAEAYQNQFKHYRKVEQSLQAEIDAVDVKSTQELFDAQDTIDNLIDDIGSGERKLFVSTTKADCRLPDDPKAASVDHAAGRTRLNKKLAQEIVRLTARGDRAIIQLTACQEYARFVSGE